MADDFDVVIVGSGFAGALIANELAKRGKSVAILEAGDGIPPNINDYMERFYKSAEVYDLPIPYSKDALSDATLEVIRATKLEAAYIRPIAYFDASTLSVWTISANACSSFMAASTGRRHRRVCKIACEISPRATTAGAILRTRYTP